MEKKIWLFESYSDQDDIDNVVSVLKRGTFWAMGPEIEQFEKLFADVIGTKHAICFNSGTSALHANLLANDFKDGEVIVPSFTFPATANSVAMIGLKPVFADIETTSMGLDSNDVLEKITPSTKAIIPVHFGGDVVSEINILRNIAEDRGILLIEDAAHSIGASLNSRKVGTFGDSAMFSFCFNKVITTGEGGMITTDSDELSEKLQLIRSHGRSKSTEYTNFGLNLRMSSMTAALGVSQLHKLNMIVNKRREMANFYDKQFLNIDEVGVLPLKADRFNVYQLYNIYLKNRETRDSLKVHLSNHGIPTRITYNPVHLTPIYQGAFGYKKGDLPNTENISSRILTLPFHLNLTDADLKSISDIVRNHFN